MGCVGGGNFGHARTLLLKTRQHQSRQFAVLQPEDARGDVRRVHGLLAPSWHEDFCCFVVIADGTLIERTLNACSLTTTTGRQLPAPARPSFGAFAAEFLSAAAWRRSPMPRAHRPHMRLCPGEPRGKCQRSQGRKETRIGWRI
jgi:hypothetical protein